MRVPRESANPHDKVVEGIKVKVEEVVVRGMNTGFHHVRSQMRPGLAPLQRPRKGPSCAAASPVILF